MNPRTAILLAALIALAAKLACAALTRGTNDVDAFYNFGRFIWEHGLIAQYRATPEFNHTPLTGWFCAAIYGLGHGLGFNFLLRVPGIAADFIAVTAILRWRGGGSHPPAWALAILALSPVSFMVSGFHGNVDGVLTCLLVLAVLECCAGRPGWCGWWLGLACNVKIIPLLIAPVFFFHWLARGDARRFFVVAALVIVAGWAVPLVTIPETFLRNVLGYSSNWGAWGVTWWLGQTGVAAFAPVGFAGLTPEQRAIMAGLKIAIAVAVLAIAWKRRALPAEQSFATISLVWAVFFVLAPGVGAQYLVWSAPFMLVHSPRWFAAVTCVSSVFLFVFYHAICGGLPWDRGVSTAELVPRWAAWSNLPWLALAAYLVAQWRSAPGARGYSSSSSASASGSSSGSRS